MDNLLEAINSRKENSIVAKYGISYLDDTLLGIGNNDFILIGADSGAGKTELSLKIAISAAKTLRVAFFSLEAEKNEMYWRQDYKHRAKMFYEDPERPPTNMGYNNFFYNKVDLGEYKEDSLRLLKEDFDNIEVITKGENFTVDTFVREVIARKDSCDMIIVDHIDYFDLDSGEDENSHMTKLMKSLRKINQIENIIVIAISHLRKRGNNKSPVPAIEDFIGSSNKYKQAKTTILFSPDSDNFDPKKGLYGTFVYSPKSRIGGSNGLVSKMVFNRGTNDYEKEYELYKLTKFGLGEKVPLDDHPRWSSMNTRIENQLSYTKDDKRGF